MSMPENPFANMDGLTLGDLGSLRDEWMKQYGAGSQKASPGEKVLHRIAAMKEQRDQERIEAGHELASIEGRAKAVQRDIVDMDYDDGLTPKEALEIQKVRPIGFLGKDILAVEKEVKPAIEHSEAYRKQLAHDFRRAIEALPPIPEKTCSCCGVDVGAADDHKIVDREPMCLPCVREYGLEQGRDYER